MLEQPRVVWGCVRFRLSWATGCLWTGFGLFWFSEESCECGVQVVGRWWECAQWGHMGLEELTGRQGKRQLLTLPAFNSQQSAPPSSCTQWCCCRGQPVWLRVSLVDPSTCLCTRLGKEVGSWKSALAGSSCTHLGRQQLYCAPWLIHQLAGYTPQGGRWESVLARQLYPPYPTAAVLCHVYCFVLGSTLPCP
jgi:hypothetical protein